MDSDCKGRNCEDTSDPIVSVGKWLIVGLIVLVVVFSFVKPAETSTEDLMMSDNARVQNTD
jgi:hypothetical protein